MLIAALQRPLLTEAPVEAVDEPLTDGAEVSDVGHHCAVSGVSLQVHWKCKWSCNICNIPQLKMLLERTTQPIFNASARNTHHKT